MNIEDRAIEWAPVLMAAFLMGGMAGLLLSRLVG